MDERKNYESPLVISCDMIAEGVLCESEPQMEDPDEDMLKGW